MSSRVAFVTIGQSPRNDLLPEILSHTHIPLEATERGALDGLTDGEIAELAPTDGEARLVTRLRSGNEVIVSVASIEHRLGIVLRELDGQGFDLLVLLCTGRMAHFLTSTPLLLAQQAVDNFVLGVAGTARSVGVILPNPEQTSQFQGLGDLHTEVASVSPFAHDAEALLRSASTSLANVDVILLHCMGFTEAMRRAVHVASGKPTLAPRRLLAHAIDILLT